MAHFAIQRATVNFITLQIPNRNYHMKTIFKNILVIFLLSGIVNSGSTQGMPLGKIIVLMTPDFKKDAKPEALQTFIKGEIFPMYDQDKPGSNFYLFQADRGDKKGSYLLVCGHKTFANREKMPAGSPFTDKILSNHASSSKASDFFSNSDTYTEYQLIGSENFQALPDVGILGIHYIKVKKGRSEQFEKFVKEKMHPAVGDLLPDMHLLTYKATAGDRKGTYITIFAITSVEARDLYWPAGRPETEILKQSFAPHKKLAGELGGYLAEGSYLEPTGGAAAIFESKEWTDYIHQK